ncbi:MAG: nitrilase-related carbon-nitrogen hydrolase, partial [Pseudomonadota bacterium]
MTEDSFFDAKTHGYVRIACATPMGTTGKVEVNADETLSLARQADEGSADIVLFPELNLSSYAIDDLHMQGAQIAAVDRALRRIVEASGALACTLVLGAALPHGSRLYNCAVVVAGGRVQGVVPKSYLPNYREFYEKRHFAPGAGVTGLTMDVAGASAPFGTDLIFAHAR